MTVTIAPPPASLLMQQRLHVSFLWQLTQPTGTIFRFTDHDKAITYQGQTYSPVGGFDASASRAEAGLNEHTRQFDGMIQSNKVTNAGLRAGLFDETEVVEVTLDWMYPWGGAMRTRRYWIDRVSFDGERWQAELSGLVRFLRAEAGKVLSRTCHWRLFEAFGVAGKAGCKKDPTGFIFSPCVVGLVTSRRQFRINAGVIPGSKGADWFTDGSVVWLGGSNAPTLNEISTHGDSAGGTYSFELYLESPFDIQVGDTCLISTGCDKRAVTCETKFNIKVNYGGVDDMPYAETLLHVEAQGGG